MRRHVLFVDFDGVLHRTGATLDKLFSNLPMLEAWLRRRPSIDVVVSSSWAQVHPIEELRSYFSEDLQARVLGALGRSSARHVFERQAHAELWMAKHGCRHAAWAALDDEAWQYSPGCEQLVVCDPKVGLTERELDELDERLQLYEA